MLWICDGRAGAPVFHLGTQLLCERSQVGGSFWLQPWYCLCQLLLFAHPAQLVASSIQAGLYECCVRDATCGGTATVTVIAKCVVALK